MIVDRVTFHHEGAGTPTDNMGRFLSRATYSVGIGLTRYELARPPEKSFVTVGQGGVRSLQVCFSGNRQVHPVKDSDVELVVRAVGAARTRGWVTNSPEVFLHRDTVSTACPGRHVAARRGDLAVAVRTRPVPPPVPPPIAPAAEKGDDMIEQPNRTTDPTRPAIVRLDRDNNLLLCFNGASVAGDQASPFGFRFAAVPSQGRVTGIVARADGVVVVDNYGHGFIYTWS